MFRKLVLIIKISKSQNFKNTFKFNLTCIYISFSQNQIKRLFCQYSGLLRSSTGVLAERWIRELCCQIWPKNFHQCGHPVFYCNFSQFQHCVPYVGQVKRKNTYVSLWLWKICNLHQGFFGRVIHVYGPFCTFPGNMQQ